MVGAFGASRHFLAAPISQGVPAIPPAMNGDTTMIVRLSITNGASASRRIQCSAAHSCMKTLTRQRTTRANNRTTSGSSSNLFHATKGTLKTI